MGGGVRRAISPVRQRNDRNEHSNSVLARRNRRLGAGRLTTYHRYCSTGVELNRLAHQPDSLLDSLKLFKAVRYSQLTFALFRQIAFGMNAESPGDVDDSLILVLAVAVDALGCRSCGPDS